MTDLYDTIHNLMTNAIHVSKENEKENLITNTTQFDSNKLIIVLIDCNKWWRSVHEHTALLSTVNYNVNAT